MYPFGLSLLLLAIASALRRRARWTRALCFSAFLLLLLFSFGEASQLLLGSLEHQYAPVPIAAVPAAQAIVVLGGDDSSGPAVPGEGPELGKGSGRLLYAARLFRAGKAPLVLFAGGAFPFLTVPTPISEAQASAQLLKEWGVSEQAILLEDQSRNTRENAVNSFPILQRRGVSRILLVTSAFHMPRASAVFRKAGFQVIPAPVDFQTIGDRSLFSRFVPDVDSLSDSQVALKEWLGLFVYRLRGWV
jgi:uncharacterized SAM-binding protein YcdF (DUF218 family)